MHQALKSTAQREPPAGLQGLESKGQPSRGNWILSDHIMARFSFKNRRCLSPQSLTLAGARKPAGRGACTLCSLSRDRLRPSQSGAGFKGEVADWGCLTPWMVRPLCCCGHYGVFIHILWRLYTHLWVFAWGRAWGAGRGRACCCRSTAIWRIRKPQSKRHARVWLAPVAFAPIPLHKMPP